MPLRNGGSGGSSALPTPAVKSDYLIYDGSSWVNKEEHVNILTYGADPSGATGSSTAFRNAIDTALAGSVTSVILVPPGVYSIDSDITSTFISGQVGFRIHAHGAVFKPASGVTCFRPKQGIGWQMFIMDGAVFDGSAGSNNTGIEVENVQSGAKIVNCHFTNIGTGVSILNSGTSNNNFCESVTLKEVNMFGCLTGLHFNRTGTGPASQEEPFLSNVRFSECTTSILVDGGVGLQRSRLEGVTIWNNSGQTGIKVNSGFVGPGKWNVYFEGTDLVGGTAIDMGASAVGVGQLKVESAFINWASPPGVTNNGDAPLAIFEEGSQLPHTCRIYKSGGQFIPNAVYTPVTYDQEDFDYYSIHSTLSNTSRISPPYPGIYDVVGYVQWLNTGGGNNRAAVIAINGSIYKNSYNIVPSASADLAYTLVDRVKISSGNYIQLQVFQDSGGTMQLLGSSLSAERIAEIV